MASGTTSERRRLAPVDPTVDARDELGDTLSPPRPTGDAPAAIGRYQITRKIGVGGMGTVYAAHDPDLDREVALKLLHGDDHPRRGDRLLREAQAMAKLSHPNVAHVYEVGTIDGCLFIAMELIHGTTLRHWLDTSPPWPAIVERFIAAGRGLHAAHAAGVVHRDFKPDNVLVGDDGRVVVVDFGVAHLRPRFHLPRGTGSSQTPAAAPDMSVDGAVVGTPAYMSPEQWLGGHVDARSDQFSFCAALYEAVHGRRPFAGHGAVELARNVLSGTIDPSSRARRAPRWLDRLLLRGLAVHPERRFPSMLELLTELARDRQRRRRRRFGGALGLALAGGLGFGLSSLRRDDPCAGAGARVHAVWSPERIAAAEHALLAGGAAYAPATWQRVRAHLDAYAGAWQRAAAGACAATRVRGEASEELLDLRDACLGTRLRALDAALASFERDGEAALDRALETLAGLPDIDLCADAEYVRARVPPPPSHELAVAVESLRDRLAGQRTALDVRDPHQLLPALLDLERRAESLAYRPALAEVLVVRGLALHKVLDPAAPAVMRRAYQVAAAAGHDEMAFEAALNIAFAGPVDAATEAWLVVAESLLDRLGADDLAQARFHHVRLLSECRAGRCARPLDPLLAAIDRHRHTVGDDHPSLARLQTELANIYMLRRDRLDAERTYADALARFERVLGRSHPRLVVSLGNLARLALQRGDLPAAAAHIARAREILGDDFSPLHPFVLGLRKLEVDHAEAAGDFEAAAAILARAIADAGDRSAPQLAVHHFRLAALRRALGRRSEALAGLRDAGLAESPVPETRLLAGTWIALLAAELGDRPLAAELIDRTLELRRTVEFDDPADEQTLRLARALTAATDDPRAAALDLAALLDAELPQSLRGDVALALARLVAAADPPRARALATDAAAAYLAAGPLYRRLHDDAAALAARLR
jgi:predicted Ser/Thr protein kinase